MNTKQKVHYEVTITSNDGTAYTQVHHVDRKFNNIEEIKKIFNFEDSTSKFTVTRVVTEKTEIITQ